uniref:Uncharacterized protein n=1 Tax=Oryza glumipatula TaxID=40148 RepID=A0A0D9Z065_9ORYZ
MSLWPIIMARSLPRTTAIGRRAWPPGARKLEVSDGGCVTPRHRCPQLLADEPRLLPDRRCRSHSRTGEEEEMCGQCEFGAVTVFDEMRERGIGDDGSGAEGMASPSWLRLWSLPLVANEQNLQRKIVLQSTDEESMSSPVDGTAADHPYN